MVLTWEHWAKSEDSQPSQHSHLGVELSFHLLSWPLGPSSHATSIDRNGHAPFTQEKGFLGRQAAGTAPPSVSPGCLAGPRGPQGMWARASGPWWSQAAGRVCCYCGNLLKRSESQISWEPPASCPPQGEGAWALDRVPVGQAV